MSEQQQQFGAFESEVARIVEEGREVRERVASLLASAATRAGGAARDLAGLVQAAANGAVAGLRGEAADDQRLREAIDGVGDGLSRAALATRLACDEAVGRGRVYAREDIEALAKGLGGAAFGVVESFGKAIASAGDQFASQAVSLREHSERVVASVEPALRGALAMLTDDPKGAVKDVAQASTASAREAAGALFTRLGGLLQSAGDKLRGGE